MSVSLYYRAKFTPDRTAELTADERARIAAIVARQRFDNATILQDRAEPFTFYGEPTDGNVLSGSAKLPPRMNLVMKHLDRWLATLSDLRNHIDGLDWHVAVDDHEIPWDPATRSYDPNG